RCRIPAQPDDHCIHRVGSPEGVGWTDDPRTRLAGEGHNERRFSVKFESPGPKLREQVLAIRNIWNCWQTGARLDFNGEFYRFDLMTPMFNPGPIEHPRIPIYISGVNQYMCRVAGEGCEGLHVDPFNSSIYLCGSGLVLI